MNEEQILAGLETGEVRRELEMFFNSPTYAETVRQLEVNNAKFKELPEAVRLSVLYLNNRGLDIYLQDMWRYLYKTRVPTIEEYFTPEYGGPMVEKIYPGWKTVILRDFEKGFKRPAPSEIVLTGAIGIGKTTIARFLHGYNLLRVCSLINPQATFNVTQDTLLVLALFTVTLDKASLALIKPFIHLLAQSPRFQQVGKVDQFQEFGGSNLIPYVVRSKYVEFPNNVIINLGSKVEHAISYSLFGAMLDEAEFRGSVQDTFDVYTNLKERIDSRFLGSQYTLLTLISSAKYSQGIIADYIKKTPPDDPHTKIYSFAIWDIKHFESYASGYFYVLRGTASHPHRILTADEGKAYETGEFKVPIKCEVIKVPEVYRRRFEDRIAEALKNLAGMALESDSSYIFTEDVLEFSELTPELSLESNLGDGKNLFAALPQEMFNRTLGTTKLRLAPSAPRYLHYDNAETGVASLCLLHPEKHLDRTVYVADLVLSVVTQTRIDMDAVSALISALGSVCHIERFTADQYQSTQMRQRAEVAGAAAEVDLFSTIKTTEPYETFARIVQNKQLYVGACPQLQRQLDGIQITTDRKVVQPKDGAAHGDEADAVCGALYSCIMDFSKAVEYDSSEWIGAKPDAGKAKLMTGYDSL